jgi:beta-N-acetylhexosaminidase
MSREAKQFGKFFNLGFEGTSLDEKNRGFFLRARPGGITFFQRNIVSPRQTAELIIQIKKLLEPDQPLICLDFEGGTVNRLRDFLPNMPSAREIYRSEYSRGAYNFGLNTGRVLASLGFDLNFAPVVDLYSEYPDNGIGDRAFSSDPRKVREWAETYLEGLADNGAIGCLKHFPGLSRSTVDSHKSLPVDKRTLNDLLENDLIPYDPVPPNAAMVMLSHCAYPEMFSSMKPASLEAAAYDLLRDRLGFRGVTITDDLVMGALENEGDMFARVKKAFQAGADMALICRNMDEALEAVEEFNSWMSRNDAGRKRIDESFHRLDKLRSTAKMNLSRKFDSVAFSVSRTAMEDFDRAVKKKLC